LVSVLAPLGFLFVRRSPEAIGLKLESAPTIQQNTSEGNISWLNALRTPAFWVFALASAVYNLVVSGIGLFNESILAERGFEPGIYHRSLVIIALTSLVGNLLGGWLAEKWSVQGLMATAMGLLAGALLGLPWLRTVTQVDIFAVVMGVAGGFVIVIFFSFWARTFGRSQLGRIQGTAQMLTVLASALGPLVLAKCHEWTGSYAAVFYVLGAVVILLGLAAWLVPMPRKA
jgi:cyanate permease